MSAPRKIATCCYCGTRAVLVLSGTTRHELACSACGAPLHEMKMLPVSQPSGAAGRGDPPGRKPKPGGSEPKRAWSSSPKPMKKTAKRAGKKSRRGGMSRLFGRALAEAFDALEDLID
jgi:hypothetical protein